MNKAIKNYVRFELDGNRACIKKDKVDLLRDIEAVIFDCDGVLIDIRDSYDRAISETVAYVLERLTGYPFSRETITNEIIFLFRKTGGFNNDCDICYGILMFMLCNLPADFQEIFMICMEDIDINEKPLKRLLLIEKAIRAKDLWGLLNKTVVNELVGELKLFVDNLDESGLLSVDKSLLNTPYGSIKDYYESLKRLLYYPCRVGKSVIPTVFEEIFCGSTLFEEFYGLESVFYSGQGLIKNESIIIRPETLNRLSSIFGRANFGIASGSRFKSAEHVLGSILSYFSPEALVFLDDIEREEENIMKSTGKTVSLKKPNPFSLLMSAKGLMPFKAILYVGDSMEDALVVGEARKEDPRFTFAGVYQYSGLKDALLQSFLKAGADIILPSVNDLPSVLYELKGKIRR